MAGNVMSRLRIVFLLWRRKAEIHYCTVLSGISGLMMIPLVYKRT